MRKSIATSFKKNIKSFRKNKRVSKGLVNSLMSYYGWLKHSDSYNFMRKFFTGDVKKRGEDIAKELGFKNPLAKIYIAPKRDQNRFGRYQPTLF